MSYAVRDRVRSALALVGVAALAISGLGVTAQAAGADLLQLGHGNKAKKSTSLVNKGKGPALKLKAKKGPALSVNTKDLVTNLNADSVDGKGLDEVAPPTMVFNLGVSGQSGGAQPFVYQTTTLPAGTYEFSVFAKFNQGGGDVNQCFTVDLTKYIASGATDSSAIFAGGVTNATAIVAGGYGVAAVTAGNRLGFVCIVEPTSSFSSPAIFTVRRIDRVTSVPGLAPTTLSKHTARSLG